MNSRPFINDSECLKILNEHSVDDRIRNKNTGEMTYIMSIGEKGVITNDYEGNIDMYSFAQAFNDFVFIDNKPFGVYSKTGE